MGVYKLYRNWNKSSWILNLLKILLAHNTQKTDDCKNKISISIRRRRFFMSSKLVNIYSVYMYLRPAILLSRPSTPEKHLHNLATIALRFRENWSKFHKVKRLKFSIQIFKCESGALWLWSIQIILRSVWHKFIFLSGSNFFSL